MHVLAIEDAPSDAALLAQGFARHVGADHTLAIVDSVDDALPRLREQRPDLIILDLHLPGTPAMQLFSRHRELVGETPVLVWTGDADPAARDQACAIASGYLHKTVATGTMWASAMALAREAAQRPRVSADVFVVNDNEAERLLWRDVFEPWLDGGALVEAGSVGEARARLTEMLAGGHVPRVALIDFQLPGETGDALLEWLASRPEFAATRGFVLTGSISRSTSERCLRLGAREILVKPFTLDGWNAMLPRVLGRPADVA